MTACLMEAKAWTTDKLHFLAWTGLEVSVELLWSWGCSAELLKVQPLPCPVLHGLGALVPPYLEL